jgi:hypothetical protein
MVRVARNIQLCHAGIALPRKTRFAQTKLMYYPLKVNPCGSSESQPLVQLAAESQSQPTTPDVSVLLFCKQHSLDGNMENPGHSTMLQSRPVLLTHTTDAHGMGML